LSLHLYDSKAKKKIEFVPLEPGKVRMYCCGPTVYDFLHVGNFRGAVFYNLAANWLRKLGYEVNFVYNFTDVDDKILKRAQDEGTSAKAISSRFIEEFKKDFAALNLTPHSSNPKVSDYMDDIIALISKIIANKKAYVVDGEVFYSISSFSEYGKLSHRKPEDMISGSRVKVDPKKKSPLDFTLWKPAKEGEESWDSPWGSGRPGWHIECSAMSKALLGEQIDIHGGGMDLIFPHHENEIAQSEGAYGKDYVGFWVHNNMFTFGGSKMSKSLGNIRTMRSFLEIYDGEIFKYLVLSVHYRSESDFTETTIQNSISALGRIYSAMAKAVLMTSDGKAAPDLPKDDGFKSQLMKSQQDIQDLMNDDFATPQVMAQVFNCVRLFNQKVPSGAKKNGVSVGYCNAFLQFIEELGEPMALFQEDPQTYLQSLDSLLLKIKGLSREKIESLIEERAVARKEKNYERSDEIRDQLLEMSIDIRDGADETSWEVQKK